MASFLCVCALNADKLRRNIVKVFVDTRGFAERGEERQTVIIRKKKQVKGQVKVRDNPNFVSQNDSETPRVVDKH